MEQKVQNLEEEVKLLKNQIRAVLLDIKESLASGEWQAVGRVEGKEAGRTEERDEEEELREEEASAAREGKGDGDLSEEEAGTHQAPVRVREVRGGKEERNKEERKREEESGWEREKEEREGKGKKLEPITLIMLMEWIEKTEEKLGGEETEKLVELYTATAEVGEETRETLRLVMGLRGKEGKKGIGSVVPYLMELDDLMQERGNGKDIQSTLLKIMANKHKAI
jgi:hypothetical protein